MENLEAIKIVKKLLNNQMNITDHFYSGDRDTFFEAYDNVMVINGHKEFYEASDDERKTNSEKYKTEIHEQFEKIVFHGKELMIFYKKVDELLDDFNEQEQLNND